MAFSPVRSLSFISRRLKLSPVDVKQKHSTSLSANFGKGDEPLQCRSPNYWNQINALSLPSTNYKTKKRSRDCVSYTANTDYLLPHFQKQSTVKYKELIGCCLSPEDVSVNTPDRSGLSEVISHKTIKYILGSGAFGTVLKGCYKGERIAVKVVPKLRTSSLANEGNALWLNHVNIIRILKIIVEKEYGLVFMERNFGPNVHELLHQSNIPINALDRIRYMLNIAHALEHCHNLKILHLDVKPKNILLSISKNICKLCDFGCSVHVDDVYQHHLQKINFGVNTVCYTDPQLLTGKLPSSKSDVYSFGVTMWQVISREIPYDGIDCHTIIYKVVSENYRPREVHGITEHDKRYIDLYQLCWKMQPGTRPEIKYVVEEMEKILIEEKLERSHQDI